MQSEPHEDGVESGQLQGGDKDAPKGVRESSFGLRLRSLAERQCFYSHSQRICV